MLRINNLSLSAFRGINIEIALDFTSPLTLIYAANGTGKTTICDGVEWLLTGEIARLAASREDDFAQLRCQFADATREMRITGSLMTSLGKSILTRTQREWLWAYEGAEEEKASANQVLKAISPHALVSDDAHHTQGTRIRRDWIRGARLFTEHTRSMLLDVDEVNIRTRERVLSDLLGVGELAVRAEKLRTFADYLNSGSQTEKGLAALKKEFSRLQDLSRQLNEEEICLRPGMSLRDHAREELIAAASAVCGAIEEPDFDLLFSKVRLATETEKHRVRERKGFLERLIRYWPEMPSLEDSLRKATVKQTELSNKLAAARNELIVFAQSEDGLISRLAGEERKLEVLFQKKATIVAAAYEVASRRDEADPGGEPFSIDDLFTMAGKWTEHEIAEIRALAQRLQECLLQLSDEDAALAAAERLLAQMERTLSTDQHIEQLRDKALHAGEHFSKKSKEHSALTGPLEALRLATRIFIEGMNLGSACPVCGKNWQSADNLRAAVLSTISASPDVILRLEQEVVDAERAAKEAKTILETAEAFRASYFVKKDFIAQARERRHRQLLLIRKYRAQFSSQTDILSLRPATSGSAAEYYEKYERKAALIQAIHSLRSRLEEASFAIDKSEFLNLHLHAFVEFLNQRQKDLEDIIRRRRDELAQKQLDSSRLRTVIEETVTALAHARASVEQQQPLWDELKELWFRLSGDAKLVDQELNRVVEDLRNEEQRVMETEAHLESAQSALVAESRRREATNLKNEMDRLKEKITDVTRTRESALKAAILLESKANSYCYDQTNQLFDVAFPMFSRVHSNEVFDRIHPGSRQEPFNWIAESLHHKFSPSTHFSMGQRQDLALAIFLSRARSLGGTFVLDEPVIHLDDLNRIALLDMFRVLVTESGSTCNFVVTTANRSLVRHLEEKFTCVPSINGVAPLAVYELDGNPKGGINVKHHRVGASF